MKKGKTRILLVDDHAVVRFGIAQLINRQNDMEVCGEEEDASRAMAALNTLKPDLVIADISLKDSSGLELMRNIKAQCPGLPVLVVSVHDESIYAEIEYFHNNPVRRGLVACAEDWPWSSAGWYAGRRDVQLVPDVDSLLTLVQE